MRMPPLVVIPMYHNHPEPDVKLKRRDLTKYLSINQKRKNRLGMKNLRDRPILIPKNWKRFGHNSLMKTNLQAH